MAYVNCVAEEHGMKYNNKQRIITNYPALYNITKKHFELGGNMDSLSIKKRIVYNDKSENTYQLYENVLIKDHSALQSLFNGAIFRDCEIKRMDFSRCDYEGTLLQNCNFEDVNLFHTYNQSSIFTNCHFSECNFNSSQITSCVFENCTFVHCDFSSSIISDTRFTFCKFNSCAFKGANITLSYYKDNEFINIVFGDCSFYQQILKNNKYSDVSINIDSIGQVFGLTLDEIHNFSYVFLGESYGVPLVELSDKISKIYLSRNWIIPKIILDYNMEFIDEYKLISDLNVTLCDKVQKNEIIKKSEIDFIIMICNQLYEEEKLPLFALYTGILKLKDTFHKYNEKYHVHVHSSIIYYINSIFELVREMISSLYNNAEYLSQYSLEERVSLVVRYNSDTNLELYNTLNESAILLNFSENYYTDIESVSKGSIIEIMATCVGAIFLLQVCLYGINGCLIQITDLKSKIEIIKKKNLPRNYVKQSIMGKQQQPEILKVILDKLDDNMLVLLIRLYAKYKGIDIMEAAFGDSNNISE